VAAAGDLNGDGIDDLAVGTATDKAYVVFGSADPAPTVKLSDIAAGRGGFKILAESPNDRAGKSLAGVGDLNGDGIDDLLIGAPYDNAGAQSAGAAYVVFGRTAPFGTVDLRTIASGEGGFKITGAAMSDSAGTSVAPAGDVNGDGFTDLLIGRTSWVSSYESHAGGVYVVLGHGGPYGAIDLDDVASGIGGFEIVAARGDDFVSGGVAAGDVNGDGLDDILIGASGWSGTGAKNVGAAYVVYGNPNWGVNDGLHTLIGSFGADRLAGGVDDDTLWGLAGDDRLDGGSGHDSLNGGSGNDRLTGGIGDDRLNGGDGRDSADFTRSAGAITANLATGTATGDGSDRLSGIENVLGSRFDDSITGDRGDNRLTGGAGDDRLDGGAGRDTAVYADAPEPLMVDLARGIALGDGLDHLTGIENILGSRFGDMLIGDAGDNWLTGRLGDDLLDGGAGQDTASFAYAPAPVTADLALGIAVGEGTDILIGIDNLKGSAYDDTLRGNALGNDLIGGAGDDRLSGGSGPDWLMGGAGADTFVFEPGSDGDTVRDFQPGVDVIDIRAYDLTDFDPVSSGTSYDRYGVLINLGDGDYIILNHLIPEQLEAGDFLLR
jgi:Ca2+-binding RTX toxin-like protein